MGDSPSITGNVRSTQFCSTGQFGQIIPQCKSVNGFPNLKGLGTVAQCWPFPPCMDSGGCGLITLDARVSKALILQVGM